MLIKLTPGEQLQKWFIMHKDKMWFKKNFIIGFSTFKKNIIMMWQRNFRAFLNDDPNLRVAVLSLVDHNNIK